MRHDRARVPEGNVQINFVIVSQTLRAAPVGKWTSVSQLLRRVPHWGVCVSASHAGIFSDLRRLFSQIYESKLLAAAEGVPDPNDVVAVRRTDLTVLLKRWRARCVLRADTPLVSVAGHRLVGVKDEASALRDHWGQVSD